MFLQYLRDTPLVRVQELLGPGVGHPQLSPHRLDRVVEYLLYHGHAEALVGEVLGVVVVVELAGPALVIEVIEAVIVLVQSWYSPV